MKRIVDILQILVLTAMLTLILMSGLKLHRYMREETEYIKAMAGLVEAQRQYIVEMNGTVKTQ